ncbi:MAG: FAD-dependent oxidoreductase [Myxococcota bacterium]
MKARLVNRTEVAERTGAFLFEIEGGRLGFRAGQSCDVKFPQARHQDAKGFTRTFSIASSPADEPRVLVVARLTGSAFKRSLWEAPLGSPVEIEGPYGSFTLHQESAKPAILLAGGIGVTPFRSIIKDAIERKLPHRLVLFYSNRNAASAAFMDDLVRWTTEHPNFQLVATLTQPRAGEPWPHFTGSIGPELLRRHVPDPRRAVFYLAGSPRFVAGLFGTLLEVGANPDDIRVEEFAGY